MVLVSNLVVFVHIYSFFFNILKIKSMEPIVETIDTTDDNETLIVWEPSGLIYRIRKLR
jgi:hypothetical protein